MSEIRSFRDLEVWKKSMSLAEHVYGVLRKFPAEERFGLADQLRRAVISIPSNIAEGRGRGSAKDFSNFLCMARGSLNEVVTQLELAKRLGYLQSGSGLYEETMAIGKMLNAMIKRLRTKPVESRTPIPESYPLPKT